MMGWNLFIKVDYIYTIIYIYTHFVYVCICIYIYTYTMYTYMYMYMHLYVCMYVCMHVYMYVYMYIRITPLTDLICQSSGGVRVFGCVRSTHEMGLMMVDDPLLDGDYWESMRRGV